MGTVDLHNIDRRFLVMAVVDLVRKISRPDHEQAFERVLDGVVNERIDGEAGRHILTLKYIDEDHTSLKVNWKEINDTLGISIKINCCAVWMDIRKSMADSLIVKDITEYEGVMLAPNYCDMCNSRRDFTFEVDKLIGPHFDSSVIVD